MTSIHQLALLQYQKKLRFSSDRNTVFDPARKKYVKVNPEEITRQLILLYLKEEHGISYSRMAVEKEFQVSGKKYRFDIAIYNRLGRIDLLVECKSPEIALHQNHLDQIAKYNLSIKAPFILVSNGFSYILAKINSEKSEVELIQDLAHCFNQNS